MASGESISMAIESYRDLDVWRRRREIVKAAYWLTVTFPEEERFGLTAQIRRAATSVPANIAEGWGRHYPAEFIQFLRKANGSLAELETHLLVSIDLGYLAQQEAEALVGETQILGKQILSLERNLNRKRVNSEQ
jgi:four helix bundle protein